MKKELKAIKHEAQAIVKNGGPEGALAALLVRLCDVLDPRRPEQADSEAWEMEERRRDRSLR